MLLLRRFSAWQRMRHSSIPRLAHASFSCPPATTAPAANACAAAAGRRALVSRRARANATTDHEQQGTAADQGGEAAAARSYAPPRNAYVHLPFCRRKCFYCDFPVEAIGGGSGGGSSSSSSSPNPAATSRRASERIRAYVDLVLREIDATARLLGPERGGSGAPAPAEAAHHPLAPPPPPPPAADPPPPPPLLDTVYFGGGTPSLVPPALVAEVVDALDARFGVAPGAEVTLEADPGTFDAARLREYCAPRKRSNSGGRGGGGAAGVTRLSVGVQAFQDALLEACGRSHSLRDVREAVAAVREALADEACGLRSWSLDLICGLPGLSREAWADSLAQAVATGAGHVSVYDLQVEEGTPFARWYGGGKEEEGAEGGGKGAASAAEQQQQPPRRSSPSTSSSSSLPDEDAGTAMYEQASEALRAAGYERYELSNYALLPGGGGGCGSGSSSNGSGSGSGGEQQQQQQQPPQQPPSPHRSAHNQCYWRGVPYLAFGLGAASYVRGVRYSRPRDMRAYERWVASLEEAAAGVAQEGGSSVGERRAPSAAADDPTAADDGAHPPSPQELWAPGLPSDARVETPHDRLLDRFMLALRTSDGLDLAALAREHGPDRVSRALPALERAAGAGLAELRPAAAAAGGSGLPYDWVRLTDPKGLMLSNDVISDVFALLD